MFKFLKRIVAVLCFAYLAVGLQSKAYAQEALIYSNDFNSEEERVKFSDEQHQMSLFDTETVINLKQFIYDKLTITMWLKSIKPMEEASYLVALEEDPADSKGLFIGIENNESPVWSIGSGKKGIKTDRVVVLEEWVFAALVYDADNHQFRAILDDSVYSKKNNSDIAANKLYIDATGCMVDDLQVYDGILTLEQLEHIKGASIEKGRSKYPIIDKTQFINAELSKSLSLQREFNNSNGLLQYEVASSYLTLEKKIDSTGEFIANLKKGNVIIIKSVIIPENKVFVETQDGKAGYLDSKVFSTKLIRADASQLEKLMFSYINIANGSNSKQAILMNLGISLAVVAVFVFLQRMVAKYSDIAIRGVFTPSIYVLIIHLLARLLGDEYETEWWLQGGFMSFPAGYTEFVHWFLFITTILFVMVHLVQNAVIIKNCGIIKGIITSISVIISNIIAFFIIKMIITLLLSYFDLIGLITVILFVVSCLIYLKVNNFFIKVEEFDDPDNSDQYEVRSDYNHRGSYSGSRSYDNDRTNQTKSYSHQSDTYNEGWSYQSDSDSSDHNSYNRDNSNPSEDSGQRKIQYFAGVTRLEELQIRYRNLMKIYHPDNQCGDTEVSKQVSMEYEYLKKTLSQ